MAVREITKLPDAVLRKQAHKVNDFGKNTQILIDDMIDTLHAAPAWDCCAAGK
jgi:peptide deformylase